MFNLGIERFKWWPKKESARAQLGAREVMIRLDNGDPGRAQMAPDWRRVAAGGES